jgi:hypothetical protein
MPVERVDEQSDFVVSIRMRAQRVVTPGRDILGDAGQTKDRRDRHVKQAGKD